MTKSDSQLVGAMGETIVLYELMHRGWVPANVNAFVRNARNIDVVAIKEEFQIALSVKTSGPNSATNFQLGGKPDTPLFNKHNGAKASYVCFVILDSKLSRAYKIYVVPVQIAESIIQATDKHWRSMPRRDGQPRKPGIRGIRFSGKDTLGNIASGFSEKWACYLDAWDQLESHLTQQPILR